MMIDKSLRKAAAKRYGDVIVVRMTGGGDCLWLNLYLDGATGQMVCDSDIGSYAYHWGRLYLRSESATDFWCRWLSDEEWLLRKCCGERHTSRYFDVAASIECLRQAFAAEHRGDSAAQEDFGCVLDIASGYRDTLGEFASVLQAVADERFIDLPEDWWHCLVDGHTPWQKRFAEICREVVVPAIRRMDATPEVV